VREGVGPAQGAHGDDLRRPLADARELPEPPDRGLGVGQFALLIHKRRSAGVLDAPAKAAGRAARNAFGRGRLKEALSGTWLGHAVHPMLTDVVIGSFVSATILDLLGGDEDGRAAERLIGLVNDLLDISRLESGKLTVTLQPTNLGELTQSSLDDLGALIRDKGLRLSLSGVPSAAVRGAQPLELSLIYGGFVAGIAALVAFALWSARSPRVRWLR